ncbi:MAG TPA: NHL repeat-containing protein [Candidatus Binataceae bacterium]|nr:NHL repeat-containing protein [Candidatus Binataceae bacterium]
MAKQQTVKQVRIAIVGFVCASVAAISTSMMGMAAPRTVATSAGAIYVANTSSDAVTIYPTSATGNFAPYVTISGSNTGLESPDGIALDAAGNIYVTNQDNDSVTVFPAGGGGNIAPTATIVGAPDAIFEPAGVALDSKGNVYVASPDLDLVTEYPPVGGQSGTLMPDPIATFTSSDLSEPVGVDVGARGHVYVANAGNGTVISLIPGKPPTVGLDIIGLVAPFGVTLDADRNIYVADAGAETIYQYHHHGRPVGSIAGSNTLLGEPVGVAVDSGGNIYVANQGLDSVTIYAAGSNGNVAPISSIVGGNTQLSLPVAIAVGPAVSPSATPTATTSATATPSPTATPTVPPTATVTPTPTVTSTPTVTPTPAPTPTVTIGGSEVVPGNPPTLPFPSVGAGKTATAQFKIINTGDQVTGFTLQTGITGPNAGDFRVKKSSTCVTNDNSVGENASCIYQMAETPQHPPESAQLTITATPTNGGQAQVLILSLVGGAT